jgi:hypothetical protein
MDTGQGPGFGIGFLLFALVIAAILMGLAFLPMG